MKCCLRSLEAFESPVTSCMISCSNHSALFLAIVLKMKCVTVMFICHLQKQERKLQKREKQKQAGIPVQFIDTACNSCIWTCNLAYQSCGASKKRSLIKLKPPAGCPKEVAIIRTPEFSI
jgi:hypothetical protein